MIHGALTFLGVSRGCRAPASSAFVALAWLILSIFERRKAKCLCAVVAQHFKLNITWIKKYQVDTRFRTWFLSRAVSGHGMALQFRGSRRVREIGRLRRDAACARLRAALPAIDDWAGDAGGERDEGLKAYGRKKTT